MLNPSTDADYSGKVNAPDTEFPNGSARDATVENDPNATPLLAKKFNDDWGFDAALLAAASATPSGDPDTALVSQRLEAMTKLLSHIADASGIGSADFKSGDRVVTQGLVTAGDGGGDERIINDTTDGEPVDGLKNIATGNGKFAVRDKPLYVAKAPGTAGFAPNEFKYLFMDPVEYENANVTGALDWANQFHYFGEGDDVRVEFEANPGKMQFYIEGGVGKEVWYGLQEEADHVWSFGMNPAIDRALRFCTGFGIGNKDPALQINEDGIVRTRGFISVKPGLFDATGPTVSPLVSRNTTSDGNGIISKAGDGSGQYLLDCRLADETVKFRVKPDGVPEFGVTSQTDTGYTTLPNGMVLQWGSVDTVVNTQQAILFPVAFATACNQFVCSMSAAVDDVNASQHERYDLRSAAGTTVFTDGIGTPAATNVRVQWYAIGH